MRVSKLVIYVWVLLTTKELDRTRRNYLSPILEAYHRGNCDEYERLSSTDMRKRKFIQKSGKGKGSQELKSTSRW